MRTSLSLVALGLGGLSFACSSNSAGHSSPPITTSFAKDVMPVLQNDCSQSGGICHGTPAVTTMPQPRPYLGPQFGAADATTRAMVHDGIVNTPSGELPSMPYVTPEDLSKSFLYYKITDTQGTLACTATFATPPCGLSMPFGAMPIPDADRATIQAWIVEGAPNND
jgi:hypothetical protein